MSELGMWLLGICGGVLGSFFKFFLDDFDKWRKRKLRNEEKEILRIMFLLNGAARFKWRVDGPPVLDWAHKTTHIVEDKGEIYALVEKRYVVMHGAGFGDYLVTLTPEGWVKAKNLPEFQLPAK